MNRQPTGPRQTPQRPPGTPTPSLTPGLPQAKQPVKPAPHPGISPLWGSPQVTAAQPNNPPSNTGLSAAPGTLPSGPNRAPINFANLPKLGSQTSKPKQAQASGQRSSVSSLFGGNKAGFSGTITYQNFLQPKSSPASGKPAADGKVLGGSDELVAPPVNVNGPSVWGVTPGGPGGPGGQNSVASIIGTPAAVAAPAVPSVPSTPALSRAVPAASVPPTSSTAVNSIVADIQAFPEISPANGSASLASILPGLGGTRPRLSVHGNHDTAASRQADLAGQDLASAQLSLPYLDSQPARHVPLLKSLGIDDKKDDEAFPNLKKNVPSKATPTLHQDMEVYGMKAILNVINGDTVDAAATTTTPTLGTDTSQLGLQPTTNGDQLSRTFGSPWVETSVHSVIPSFRLPEPYTVNSVIPPQQKLQNLTEETLFYIFYTMPRDAMQEAVAVELTNRNWRYHKELKLWLTKDPMSEPVQQTSQAESGIYVFFDPSSWEKVKRDYVLHYPDIA